MPSLVQTQTVNAVPYMIKGTEPAATGFTAVNGRSSPPEPRRQNGINGMNADPTHVRPHSQLHSPPIDQKVPLPGREEWPARPTENGVQNGQHQSVTPPRDNRDHSSHSPQQRKRSSSIEDSSSSDGSPNGGPVHSRRRLDAYPTRSEDSPPHSVSQARQTGMDQPHQRTLPPMDRAEHDRSWPPPDSQERSHRHYSESQYRESRNLDPTQDPNSQSNGMMDHEHMQERSGTTEMTRAGVQVDTKKRKRQFANRTKTGCGTCRRRKKKCDEAKPECNNCIRGGFICEGYANKVPWPKNGITKPPPPLQAKDRYPADPAQLYHNHGTNRETYQEPPPTSSEGARARPIVVEEHDRRNGWGSNWDNAPPPRSAYPTERPQADYPPPPPAAANGARPPSNDPHAQHAGQNGQRPHNPRIYHHTPQTMSQVVSSSAAVTAEAALHHQSQQPHQPPPPPPPPHHQPATAGPPAPPPSRYHQPQPRPQRTEKEKMLSGEPFMPYHPQLHSEREQCKGALYRLNSTSNNHLEITREERDRHFRALVAARWTQHYRGPEAPPAGTVGTQVFVDTPFHCEYGYNLHIGDYVTIGTGCRFLDSGRITIGRNTTIDASVLINSRRAPEDPKAMKGSRRTDIAAEVHIGENVYIGPNCIIYAGVKIGTGAIIEGGSVVKRDIPRDVVVSGPTAQVKTVLWDD